MVRIGPFEPIQLAFQTINTLLKKGLISYDEARKILEGSLDPKMPKNKKEEILNEIIRRV